MSMRKVSDGIEIALKNNHLLFYRIGCRHRMGNLYTIIDKVYVKWKR